LPLIGSEYDNPIKEKIDIKINSHFEISFITFRKFLFGEITKRPPKDKDIIKVQNHASFGIRK